MEQIHKIMFLSVEVLCIWGGDGCHCNLWSMLHVLIDNDMLQTRSCIKQNVNFNFLAQVIITIKSVDLRNKVCYSKTHIFLLSHKLIVLSLEMNVWTEWMLVTISCCKIGIPQCIKQTPNVCMHMFHPWHVFQWWIMFGLLTWKEITYRVTN